MVHFWFQEIICKLSCSTLKFIFPEYVRGNRQLYYTLHEIMQLTFDKTKSGKIIFNNIEKIRILNF